MTWNHSEAVVKKPCDETWCLSAEPERQELVLLLLNLGSEILRQGSSAWVYLGLWNRLPGRRGLARTSCLLCWQRFVCDTSWSQVWPRGLLELGVTSDLVPSFPPPPHQVWIPQHSLENNVKQCPLVPRPIKSISFLSACRSDPPCSSWVVERCGFIWEINLGTELGFILCVLPANK